MNLVPFATALLLASLPYEITPAGGTLELLVEKTGLLRGKTHRFVFERYRAEVQFNAAQPESSTVSLEIQAPSIVCKDTWVSAKDLVKVQNYATKDMLTVERFPLIKFSSSKVRQIAEGRFEVEGMLTIRDVARKAVITASLTAGNADLRITGSARVRLTDYGLKPPTAALGAIGTKDEMTLNFTLTANRR